MNNRPEADLLEKILHGRRSVFPPQFDTEKSVRKEELQRLLEAANWAPNHGQTEPWRFRVYSGAAKKRLGEALANAYGAMEGENAQQLKQEKLRKLPTESNYVLAIVGHFGTKAKIPEWEEVAAVAMAVQNIYLMATALGLGGYWSSPAAIEHPSLRDFLQLEDRQKVLGFFYLGVPKGSLPAGIRKSPIGDKTTWIEE